MLLIDREGGWVVSAFAEKRMEDGQRLPGYNIPKRKASGQPLPEINGRMVVHCLTKTCRIFWELFTLKLSRN